LSESHLKEISRFNEMKKYEEEAYKGGYLYVAGIDEAGRGPLAGSVVAAAVILPHDVFIEKLNDSKQLSPNIRDVLFDIIIKSSVSYGIGISDETRIDSNNILNATKMAMIKAINMLSIKPDLLLIDAVKLENSDIPQKPLIKGDCLSISIAAASILAKVTRDRMICEMDILYPQYGFRKHKGYGTAEHIAAIKKFGLCPIHRKSFTEKFVI
jgi:ribonuclease HII